MNSLKAENLNVKLMNALLIYKAAFVTLLKPFPALPDEKVVLQNDLAARREKTK